MILGIDLGTTYSVGAYIDDSGNPVVVTNMEGAQTTPSVVYFEGESSVVVGQTAKDNSIINPEDVVSAVKNDMGSDKRYHSSHGKEYSPEVVSSFILKKIVSDAEKRLGLAEPIKDVIVTKPAYFKESQITATEDAVKIAGLNLVRFINEPTAAALYYAMSTKLDHANILIYDLGGGTFDVTIIRIDGSDINVKSTGGLAKVGGRFFDQELVQHIVDYVEDKYDVCLDDDEYVDAYQELFERVEKAKWQLSNQEKATVIVKAGRVRESVVITREEFERIVDKLYRRTEHVVKKALRDAGISADDLDKVLLVGGSSKIPYIEKKLKTLLNKELSHEVHPDLVVAQGAALFGKQIEMETKGAQNAEKVIHDVCSHSIGVVTIDPKTYKRINTILIKRNSPLPVDAICPFKTAGENEAIDLVITEGEFQEITDVEIITEIKVKLPQKVEKGTAVEIRIKLDESQLVHLFLRLPSINYEEEYIFERKANLSEEKVALLTGIVADYELN